MGCVLCSGAVCPYCHTHRDEIDLFPISPYSSLLPEIRPLDLIFFRSELITSRFLRKAQSVTLGHGEFSHVGIIMDCSVLPVPPPDVVPGELYILECTTGHLTPDVTWKKVMMGVQLRRFRDVLAEYTNDAVMPEGHVAWTRLKDNPLYSSDRAKVQRTQETLRSYYNDVIHRSYEVLHFTHMLLAVIDKPFKHRIDDTFFCSELVAAVYQRIGLYPPQLDCETIAPADFLCTDAPVAPRFEPPVVINK